LRAGQDEAVLRAGLPVVHGKALAGFVRRLHPHQRDAELGERRLEPHAAGSGKGDEGTRMCPHLGRHAGDVDPAAAGIDDDGIAAQLGARDDPVGRRRDVQRRVERDRQNVLHGCTMSGAGGFAKSRELDK